MSAIFERVRRDKSAHEINKNGNLYFLINAFLGAYNRRTDVLAKQGNSDNSQLLTAINNLDRKVDIMSSNLDRIEKEAADAAANVELVRTAMEELKTISAGMQTEIQALKDQVAQGQIDQARLEAAATTFEKADEDIDALVLPSTPPEGGTGGGGTEGGGETGTSSRRSAR